MLAVGALDTENPDERRRKGLRTNPDGDVDLPDAPFGTFRYPACPKCLADPPLLGDGRRARVEVDAEGALREGSEAAVLKPAVVMFGESIAGEVKKAAEDAVDAADRLLVTGSSLATYSAWRLVKRARERGMPIGVINIGGVRGEEGFFHGLSGVNDGRLGVRADESAGEVLGAVYERMAGRKVEAVVERELPRLSLGRME
jgi:NAD-dependent deacetylase sirtuin 4